MTPEQSAASSPASHQRPAQDADHRQAVIHTRHYTRPERPMAPADFDDALVILQQAQANAATMMNILISLRANTRHLLEPFRSLLEESRDATNAVLALLEIRP
jgi:histone deacetylase complex regulatory component SIN3